MIGFTKCLSREAINFGVSVNAIAPGWIETDMTAPVRTPLTVPANWLRALVFMLRILIREKSLSRSIDSSSSSLRKRRCTASIWAKRSRRP